MVLETQLRWLFREQPTEDYGIDAHTEVVDGEEVTGRLLALQIKSGSSWFNEPAPGGRSPSAQVATDGVTYTKNHDAIALAVHIRAVAQVLVVLSVIICFSMYMEGRPSK